MQAVILVGGLGTRLGDLTRETPKPLMPIGDKPFLEYLIQNLSRYGFTDILLLAGFRADKIVEHFQGQERFRHLHIHYSVEQEPAGTAGALRIANDLLQDEFLLINGDTYFDMNYLDLMTQQSEGDWIVKMAVRNVDNSDRYGSVKLEGNQVVGFVEKGQTIRPALINCGVYYLRKTVLEYIKELPCFLEQQVLPALVSDNVLYGYEYGGFFIDIGILSDLEKARKEMPLATRPAIFLDRDGVLNEDRNYVHLPEQIIWIPGAIETVKWFNDRGYYVFVVTNQAGVARGYYQEDNVVALHKWINRELRQFGAHIDYFYYCPHHPEFGVGEYLQKCECRKPRPGMLLEAFSNYRIDKKRSLLIGDKKSDIAAALELDIPGFLFDGGDLYRFISTILKGF